MKRRKKTIIVLVVLFAVCVLLWKFGFSLEYLHDRSYRSVLTSAQKERIELETVGMSEKELYEYSIRFAADELSFSERNDISNGKANCIGYALLCSEAFNYGAVRNDMSSKAIPVVGYVKFLGINLCNVLQSVMPNAHWKAFVQDHDFVEFLMDNESFYADPCAYDLILTDCKTNR